MDSGVFLSVLFGLLIVIPIFLVWAFALVDLFARHDLRGIAKVAWLFAILIFPILGTLIYFLTRPHVTPAEAPMYDQAQAGYVADKLTQLTELRDKGALSPEEYERQRARLLGT